MRDSSGSFQGVDARTLGGYLLEEQLGEGGMGAVFRAKQLQLDRAVALKVLRPGLVSSDENRMRFQREMVIAAQLAHPNLVRVLDGGTVDDTSYIAMELVTGKALVDVILEGAPFHWGFALAVVAEIARGLDYLHEHEVLHRDIKPSNVLVGRDGQVKLLDFGLARYIGATVVTEDGAVVGTLQFMAPELLVGAPASRASEMWSVGCVLYVLLTGRMHVEAPNSQAWAFAVVNEPVPPPIVRAPSLPAAVSQLTSKLLERDPEHRLESARELAERCDVLLEEAGTGVDKILAPGVLERLAAYRAPPEEPESRTMTIAPAQGGKPARARRPARTGGEVKAPRSGLPARAAGAFAVLVGFAVLLAFALVPGREPAVSRPSPSRSAVAPVAVEGPPEAPRARPRWQVSPAWMARLKGPRPESAAKELATTHPIPLGHEPEVWLHALRLATWFADRNRPARPPHLVGREQRMIDPFVEKTAFDLTESSARKGPEHFVSYALRHMLNYPDDARSWLILGAALERDGDLENGKVALARARTLLSRQAIGSGCPVVWQAVARMLVLHSVPDLPRQWFRWLGDEPSKYYAWLALRQGIEPRDGATYENLLERGAESPLHGEQAGYWLGVRRLEAHGDFAGARGAWEKALGENPRAAPVITALIDQGLARGEVAVARRAVAGAERSLYPAALARLLGKPGEDRANPHAGVVESVDLLEAGRLSDAETRVRELLGATPQPWQVPWLAWELALAGSTKDWVETIVRGSATNRAPEFADAAARTFVEGSGMLGQAPAAVRERFANLADAWRGDPVLPLGRALLSARQGRFEAGLSELASAPAAEPHWAGIVRAEVAARPLWAAQTGAAVAADVLARARALALPAGDAASREYLTALVTRDMRRVMAAARVLADRDVNTPFYLLSAVWAARALGDRAAADDARTRLSIAVRWRGAGRGALAEVEGPRIAP
jgi:hypothetical protein